MSGLLCLKWNNHSNTFNKLLKQIFLEDGYSDATILCHTKFYPVHRFVLSTCSEYFEEMFQQCIRLNIKHPFIIVTDIQPEQMEAILNYMYKGEVNMPQEQLPELIKAAEVLKIKGLAVPEEEEPLSKKKRSASSPSPVPKKDLLNEHFELSGTHSEKYNNFESEASNSRPVLESYSESLISEIKSELVMNASEEIPVTKNTTLEVYPDVSMPVDKEDDDYYSPCKAFDFNIRDQFQEQESEHEDNGLNLNSFTTGNYDFRKLLRSQKGEKLFKCDFCPYECSRIGNLIIHRRSHTGEKPFICNQCPYKASHKSSLTRHLRTHTAEKT